jgi:integrase
MSKAKLGSIYPRGKKGILYVDFWANGEQHRESARTTDYKEAERYLKRRQGEVATGTFAGLAPERITFAELAKGVVEDYVLNERRSLPETKMRLDKHLLPAFAKIRAAELGTAQLKRYIQARKNDGARNSTINRELSVVSRAFHLAAEHDPPKVMRIPHVPFLPEHNVRTGFLEEEQYQEVREAFEDEGVRLLFVALYHWGTRTGEIKPLKWTQIDLRGFEARLQPGTTKNGEGRVLPIYGDLVEWFQIAKEIRDQNYPDCPWVFHRGGKPIKNFRKSWDTAVAAAGVPDLIPHDMRRTAVRMMTRAGIHEKVIMQVTGHKTRNIFDRYNIVSHRDLTLFRSRMNEHLEEQRREEHSIEAQHSTNHSTNLDRRPN